MSIKEIILEKIERQNGFISFADFMEMALYTERLGYYNQIKFGEDFITAPLISPLFSGTIAQYINRLNPFPSRIVEFGAGNGQMALDILQRFQILQRLPSQYIIIETSHKLRHTQQQLIKEFAPELLPIIQWREQMPDNFDGVVLMNEVLDALPAKRFIINHQKTFELGVGMNPQMGVSTPFFYKIGDPIDQAMPYDVYPDGYCSEYAPAVKDFIAQIANKLCSGLMLIFDYGYEAHEYYHPERDHGTLCCFYRHHQSDNPFEHIAEQDISVHVDFTHLSLIADTHDFAIEYFDTQAQFLLKNGITELAEEMDLDDTANRLRVSQQIQKLTFPGQMGETVKVMALRKKDG